MRLASVLAVAAMVLCLGQSAPAALTWNGGTGTWDTTATNWLDSGSNAVAWPAVDPWDSATFAGTSEIVTLGSAITVNDMVFSGTGTTINTNGQTLTLRGIASGTGAPAFNVAGGQLNVNHASAFGAANTTMTITGNPILANTSGANVVLTLGNGFIAYVDSDFSYDANAYGATTSVHNLRFSPSSATSANWGTFVLSATRTINVFGATFLEAQTVDNGLNISSNITDKIGGVNQGYGIIKTGSGTLTLGGASANISDFTGDVVVNGGRLNIYRSGALGHDNNLVIQQTGTDPVIIGTGGVKVTGSSISTVIGNTTAIQINSDFGNSGGSWLNCGPAYLNGSYTIRADQTGTLAFGGTFNGNGNTLSLTQNLPPTVTAAATGVALNGIVNNVAGFNINGAWIPATYKPGGAVDVAASGSTLTIGYSAADTTFDGTLAGNGRLAYTPAKALTLNGSGSGFTGYIDMSAGSRLNIGNATALGTAIVNLGGTSTVAGSIDNTTGSALTIGNKVVFTTAYNGLNTFVGTNDLKITGDVLFSTPPVNLAVYSSTLAVAANTLELGGNWSIGGTATLTKTGEGTLTISGTSTATDASSLQITGGALNIGNAAALTPTQKLILGYGTYQTHGTDPVSLGNTSGSDISLTGTAIAMAPYYNGTVTVAGTNDISTTGLLTPGAVTLNIADGRNLAVGGLNGYAEMTKAGAGTLTINGANANTTGWNGNLILNEGQINLNHAEAIGIATGSNEFTINGGTIDNTSGSPVLLLMGGYLANQATYLLNGSFTFAGTNDLGFGGIAGDGVSSFPSVVSLGNDLTITTSAANFTMAVPVTGSGKHLTKDGAGTLTLGAVNTYSGGTTVSAGKLVVAATGSIGAVQVDAGTLEVLGSAGAATVNGGVLTGSGTLAGITVAGGTLAPTVAMASSADVTMTSGIYQISITDLSTFDKLNVTGAASLAGDLVLSIDPAYTPASTDTWTILTSTLGVTSTLVAPEGYVLDVVGNDLVLSLVPPPAFRAGDANGDYKIDGTDLGILGDNWDPVGLIPKTWAQGDFNGDGKVDGTDLGLLGDNWNPVGYTLPSDLGSQVPEPITMTLLAIGGLGLLARRNRR